MAVWNRDLIVQKIDKVLGDTKQILTALSGGTGAVKSVQRGTARFTGTIVHVQENNYGNPYGNITLASQIDVKIANINPAKCVVLIDGGSLECYRDNGFESIQIYVSNVSNASFTLKTVRQCKFEWQAEYSGRDFAFDEKVKDGDIVPMNHVFGWQVIEFY